MTVIRLGLQEVRPCPCGRCRSFVVFPLLNRVDASMSREEADEVVRRLNAAEPAKEESRG